MIRTIILAVFGVLLFVLALRSLRAQRLKERYVLLFAFVSAPFLVLAAWPDGVIWLTHTLEIEKATVLILGLAAFVILMLFELLSIISVQERKIAALAQVVGLLTEQQRRASLTNSPMNTPGGGGAGNPSSAQSDLDAGSSGRNAL